MQRISSTEKAREWVIDYSAARAKAIEWLGDRYLLAKPVPRRRAGQAYGSPSLMRGSGAARLSPDI